MKLSNVIGVAPGKILERILASETGKKIAIEIKAEQLAARRALVAEIAKTEAANLAAQRALHTRREAADERFRNADAEFRQARAEAAALAAEMAGQSFNAARIIAKAEIELRETAPAAIAELLSELNALFQENRHDAPPQLVGKDWLGRAQPYPTTFSSSAHRMPAIRAALREVSNVLPYEALDAEQLAARIAKIRASVYAEPAAAAAAE